MTYRPGLRSGSSEQQPQETSVGNLKPSDLRRE